MTPPPLFAQAADAAQRVTYDWTRLTNYSDWWQKPLLVLVCIAIGTFVLYMYRRDSVELKPGVGVVLLVLRLAAFSGLLLFYLGLEKRTEKRITHNSRVILLADTSLSMSRRDAGESADGTQPSRFEQMVKELAETDVLKDLRKTHEVTVYRFDQDLQRVESVGKLSAPGAEKLFVEKTSEQDERTNLLRYVAYGAFALGMLGIVVLIVGRFANGTIPMPWLWGGLAGLAFLTLFIALATLNLTHPRENLFAVLGLIDPVPEVDENPEAKLDKTEQKQPEKPIDWVAELTPRGVETRLGQAIQQILNEERNTPLAGIVVYTDGGQNAGLDPKLAMELAKEVKIPIFPIGLGSEQKPINVRISRFEAPPRVYPGDGYKISGFVQGEGLARRNMTVKLLSRPANQSAAKEQGKLEGSKQITLGNDGEELPVEFDLPGTTEIGRRTFTLEVEAPKGDSNPADDKQESEVEIVERKNKVLLIAGGPTREYQFLRTQLKRDKDTIVHVLLQSGGEGISQDAHLLLTDLPRSKEELYTYDCIVAFDPDWDKFDQGQIDLLEKWVAEQAGGMIVLAGPIYTDNITHLDKLAKIRAIYPVEFQRRFTVVDGGRFGSAKPSPIEFPRAGQEAEFLWLDDTATKSQQTWNNFPGVYGYYEVRGPKPGATVLGYYTDPEASGSQHIVYFAEQFYGAGRVFYMGSGEMWRLRTQDVGYFEQFWTKLIRHVSQGRLLRGSSRGLLLLERDRYLLGSPVVVRAQLLNSQLEPLQGDSVVLQVATGNDSQQTITLVADKARKGAFVGQFTALQEGNYTLKLEIPESGGEILTKRIQASVSDRELENPQRNGKLLKEMADTTGGYYYAGVAATHSTGERPLVGQIPDRTERSFLPGTPDRAWDKAWMTWLLVGISSVLCVEWLIRRICKLA